MVAQSSPTNNGNPGDGLTKYIKMELLGSGTYGRVFKGKDRVTGQIVALKEIKLVPEEGTPSTALREISLLKELQKEGFHRNIIQLLDVARTDTVLTIVYEYMDWDLLTFLYDVIAPSIKKPIIISLPPGSNQILPSGMPIFLIRSFMQQLLAGVAYCHRNKIIHRDVKPLNVLVNARGVLKLADFGLARSMSVPGKKLSNLVASRYYKPPESLLGSTNYSFSFDIWSVGCIMLEFFVGKLPFKGKDEEDQLQRIFQYLGTPNEQIWPGMTQLPNYKPPATLYPLKEMKELLPCASGLAQDLVGRMLKYNPAERISAREALDHPFLYEITESCTCCR